MQFAIHKLGFKVENIILFGWSIGGYTTSWAAMNYPDVKGVVSFGLNKRKSATDMEEYIFQLFCLWPFK